MCAVTRARPPEAAEPLRKEASLLHNVNNQISQDQELRTDLWSDLYLYVWPKEASRGEVGLSRPRDHARVIGSLTCYQPCSPQSPEGEEASRQDMSPIGWKVTCR